MERLATEQTGASEFVVMLRDDRGAVTIGRVLMAAFGWSTNQVWNAQHQRKVFRNHTHCCDKHRCSRALCKNSSENEGV